MVRWFMWIASGLALLVIFACNNQSTSTSQTDASVADAGRALTPEEALSRSRPRRLGAPPPVNKTPPPRLLSASHLLIQYSGAKNSKSTRTKAEALKLAKQLLAKAQTKGERFTELATKHSDAPDSRNGGYLGVFQPGKQYPEITKAIADIEEEKIVPKVLETEFGYHVVRREKMVHVGHVLVMHKESRFAHTGITRTSAEARAEAERLHKALTAADADWAAIAAKSSDCHRTKAIGGDLGYYGRGVKTIGGGRLLPNMIKALMPLRPGEISAVTETEYGFHVLWRFPNDTPGEESSATATGSEPDAGDDQRVAPGRDKRGNES